MMRHSSRTLKKYVTLKNEYCISQAMLREHRFGDLKYLGVKPDSIGIDQHWYGIMEIPPKGWGVLSL